MLRIGLTHFRSAMVIIALQAGFILLNILLKDLNINLLFAIDIVLGILLIRLLDILGNSQNKIRPGSERIIESGQLRFTNPNRFFDKIIIFHMNSTRKSGYALLIGALLMLTGASGQVVVTPGMVQQAKAMGASDAQINAAMHATSPSSSQSSRADTSADTGGNEVRREASADQRQASEDKTAVQRRSVDSLTRNTVFGQEIFSTKNLTFAPSYNMATPPSYVLGPGDEVIIEVWGEAESRVQEKISPEGSISIQGVGPINLAGLTVAEAQKRVESRIHEIMNGQVKVSLGQIRSIKVNISGEVVTPGTYTLPSLATLFNAIYSAGGVNGIGRSGIFRFSGTASKSPIWMCTTT